MELFEDAAVPMPSRVGLQGFPVELLGQILDQALDEDVTSFHRQTISQSFLRVCRQFRFAYGLAQAAQEYAVRTVAQANILLTRLNQDRGMAHRARRLCLGFMPDHEAAVVVVELINAVEDGLSWFGWELGDETCFDLLDQRASDAIAGIGDSLRTFRFRGGQYEDMQLRHLGCWLSSWTKLEHLDIYDLEPSEMMGDNSLADLFSFGPMSTRLQTLTLAVRAHVTRPLYRKLVIPSAATLRHLTVRFDDDGWMDEDAIRELVGYVAESLDTFEYRFKRTDGDLSAWCTQLSHALNALIRVRHLCLPVDALTSSIVMARLQTLEGLQAITLTSNCGAAHVDLATLAPVCTSRLKHVRILQSSYE